MRLLAFGFAGGSISSLRRLFECLPSWVEAWGAEYPGRGMRWQEPLPASLDELLADLQPGMSALLDRPCVVLGYSMGALIAYALLSRLRVAPCGFIVVSAKAPQSAHEDPDWWRLADVELLAKLDQLGGIPEEFRANADFMRWFLPVMRADLKCCSEARCEQLAALSCPLLALIGQDDALIRQQHVTGWLTQVGGNHPASAVHVLAGGHFVHANREAAVAEILANWLSGQRPDAAALHESHAG